MKRRKKPLLSVLMKKADKAVSLHVREWTRREYKGLCPLCLRGPIIVTPAVPAKPARIIKGTKRRAERIIPGIPAKPEKRSPAIQVAFHFIRRGRTILRWTFFNLVGTCSTCNYVEYRNPDLSRAWFIKNRGVDLYLQLVEQSKESFTPTVEYLEKVIEFHTKALNALKENADGPAA